MGRCVLVLLTPEGAALGETRLAPRRRAQDGAAAGAGDGRLRMREYRTDYVASGALDVHEVAVRVLHQPLQLVRVQTLLLRGRMQQIHGQRHICANNPRYIHHYYTTLRNYYATVANTKPGAIDFYTTLRNSDATSIFHYYYCDICSSI